MRQILAIVMLLSAPDAAAGDDHQYVRVGLSPARGLAEVARLGVAVDHGAGKSGTWVDLFVSTDEAAQLEAAGFPVTVLVKDWAREYARRLAADPPTAARTAAVTGHFHLGSMGGFLTLEELRADLDSMRSLYPHLVAGPDSIGSSVEGRPIWAVKISARAAVDEDEPRALYTALTHAREPGGMMTLLYTMWHLLEQYGTDPEITTLLESRELYFLPAVNPDGYAHNEAIAPTGGGMWRKNRRPNADGTVGVDLNRNYGYSWGYNDIGSSPIPQANTFRGDSAFSEPELRVVRALCAEKEFAVALNYHSYGNLLIYPWGYLSRDTGDSLRYRALAQDLVRANGYAYGTGSQTVGYVTNGDADDWMYGDTLAKPRIISFTPEIGSDHDGFWPVPSRILPQARENLRANLVMAGVAGSFIRIHDPVPLPARSDTVSVRVPLSDAGLVPVTGPVTVSLAGDGLAFRHPVTTINGPAEPLIMHAVLTDAGAAGRPARVVVRLSYAGGSTRDTVTIRPGQPSTVFEETAEQGLARWTVTSNGAGSYWAATDEHASGGRFSITDSPAGPYADNTITTLTLTEPLLLSGRGAELRFRARWAIETNYDVAHAEVSADGTVWTALPGRHTAAGSGSGRQQVGRPGYDGIRHDWVDEVMDLDAYLGSQIYLRFRLESDQAVTGEGIFLDDIRVVTYGAPLTAAPPQPVPFTFDLSQNYPNPFNPSTTIAFSLPYASVVRLLVYDALGRELRTLAGGLHDAGAYTVRFDASDLASGVYFYRLTAGDFTAVRRLTVVR